MRANANECRIFFSSDQICLIKIEDFSIKIAPKKKCWS